MILGVAVPLLAFAQQDQKLRDRDPDLAASKKLAADLQQANFHSGPWYLYSRLRISDAGFSESSYVPTGDTSGGISVTVEAPQRLYFVPRRKTIFSVEFVPGYSVFREGRREGQMNYLARADAHLLFNHLYLDIYGLRADQLRAHVADINRLATTREDEFGVAGEVKYSSRTSGLFTARIRDTSYPLNRFQPELDPDLDFNPIQLYDRTERNGRLSMLHKTLPLTSLFVSAEASKYEFRVATYKNSTRTWAGGGVLYDSGRSQIRAEAGPVKLDFDDPAQEDFQGIAGTIRATRSNGRWSYQAAAERDLGFSIFANNNFYIAHIANAGVSYSATRRLSLRANVAAERDDYEHIVDGIKRRDTVSFSSVGFNYSIRRFTTGLDVGWYERDSNYGGDVASGIRYVVRLSFTP
ncbi:MAG: hypothetical protein ACLGH0_12980 [Thermoanaerobaculia bacterium]